MRCGVVIFPGSSSDHDVYHVLKHVLGQEVLFLWHGEDTLRDCELVVLPGGFSFGDYLRPGALAARSPIMAAIRRHAETGGLVLGMGNGFEILLEARLLPGAMGRNRGLRFECREVALRVERTDLPFTAGYDRDQLLRMPIARAGGRYVDSEAALDALEKSGRVVFRYVGEVGEEPESEAAGIAGGPARGIAGICNEPGNVLGMMTHPERCAEAILGNTDGLALFAAAVGLEADQIAGGLP